MAEAEDPGDITSLAEYRRSDRQAAFVSVVDGYIIKGIPVIRRNAGELRGYIYSPGAQGPLFDSAIEMDDASREAYDLPQSVQREFNDIINRPFSWPEALA